MSVSLSDIFAIFGYANKDHQIALTKLAALRCFFDEEHKDKLISDDEADKLLSNTLFDSLEEGTNWLHEKTQKNWLRASFHKEGIGNDKDPVVNVQRWLVSEPRDGSIDKAQLCRIFKCLELIDEVPVPEKKFMHVAVHGGLEIHASERINFIPMNFSGRLYYMSNPRGLFNDEPSLAPILASWFDMPGATSIIQEVLDQNKDINASDKNWLKNLEGLKVDILEALGKQVWPTEKGWYYKNPEPFDTAAKNANRQSLAGWPTAVDMVDYLLQQRALKGSIEIFPVYSIRPGRVANTADNIEDWYHLYGRHLSKEDAVIFFSNNSKGLHFIPYQHAILKETLYKIVPDPENIVNFSTVGPGADKISLSFATDVFARILYTKRHRVLDSLAAPKKSTENSTVSLLTR